ncbi:MAG TPA: hypothetical protein VEO00_06715 [Actinomycetota bacterium]|nr:hypothetical protein [Actinomycetota bacterium]
MRTRRALVALSVAAVVGLAPTAAFAKHGADDPKGRHVREDRATVTRVMDTRGKDDPAGDDKGRHAEPEPGDDRGGAARHAEPGDDHGRHGGGEPGDDHGGR